MLKSQLQNTAILYLKINCSTRKGIKMLEKRWNECITLEGNIDELQKNDFLVVSLRTN